MNKADKSKQDKELQALMVSETEMNKALMDIEPNADTLWEKTVSKLPKEAEAKIGHYDCQTKTALAVMILAKFPGRLIKGRTLSNVLETDDLQLRHLSSQNGLYVLNKTELIPNTTLEVPSGYHMLISLESLSPRFAVMKRQAVLTIRDFDALKQEFDCRCAHCNSKEGKINRRDGKKTALQKGHIDPNKPLQTGNIIPLCDYCNRTSKNKFIFQANGAIKSPNVQDAVYAKKLVEEMIAHHGKTVVSSWV